ncbi:MAG: sulfite exporter TauE/SafE family protein [Methanomicrobiaceae archaeon]|nr:sulfite exporter TauE/SafE family protein [Methanomicrobiaceae archaeon]
MIFDSEILVYLALCISGAVAGLFSGIIGMGGGTILVPVQYSLLSGFSGINPDIALRTAIATSLAVTLPTAVSSAYGHYRKGLIIPKIGLITIICGFFGGISGGFAASNLSFGVLAPVFACVMFAMAFLMIISKPNPKKEEYKTGTLLYIIIGFSVGLISSMIGVGGGIILAPLLILFCRIPLKIASATTSLFVILVSAGGLLPYITMGGDDVGFPFFMVGYLNLTWWILLVLISIPMTQLGVFLLYRFNTVYVRYIFIVLLLYLSLDMIGLL